MNYIQLSKEADRLKNNWFKNFDRLKFIHFEMLIKRGTIACLALLALLFSSQAYAQAPTPICIVIIDSSSGRSVPSCVPVSSTNAFPTYQAGASFVNITTNTDTNVKATPGTFVGITTNTAGTTSTAKIYNDADGTCSSGLIGTVDTTVIGSIMFGANANIGICVKTAGAGAADISILYK